MKNEITIRFGIWGFEDGFHDTITYALGIKPTKQLVKGERLTQYYNPRFVKDNGWIMTSPIKLLDEYSSFEDQLESIFEILNDKRIFLKPLCSLCYCELSCLVGIHASGEISTPSIHFDKKHQDLFCDLNIDVDIDLMLVYNI